MRFEIGSRLPEFEGLVKEYCEKHPAGQRGIVDLNISVAFEPRLLLVNLGFGKAASWSIRENRIERTFLVGDSSWGRISPDGMHAAFSGNAATAPFTPFIRIWNTHTGEQTAEHTPSRGLHKAVAFSRKGSLVAYSMMHSATIVIWDFLNRTQTTVSSDAGHDTESLDFSPDAKYLFAGCFSNCIHVVDVASGRNVLTVGRAHKGQVEDMVCGNSGNYILSRHYQELSIWLPHDKWYKKVIRSGAGLSLELHRTFAGFEINSQMLHFSDSDDLILVANTNPYKSGGLKMWEVTSGTMIGELSLPQDVRFLAAWPDGTKSVAGLIFEPTLKQVFTAHCTLQ